MATHSFGLCGSLTVAAILACAIAPLRGAETIEEYLAKRNDVKNIEFRIVSTSDTVGINKSNAVVKILDATHYYKRISSSSGLEVFSGSGRTYTECPQDEILVIADGKNVYTEKTVYAKEEKEPVKYTLTTTPIAEGQGVQLPGSMDAAAMATMKSMMDISFSKSDKLKDRATVVFVGKFKKDAPVPAMAIKYLGDFTMIFDKETGMPLRAEMIGSGTGRKSASAEMVDVKWKATLDPKLFIYTEARETETAMKKRIEAQKTIK